MRRFVWALPLIVLMLTTSCKSEFELLLAGNDVPAKYKMAFELFENKKFGKAAAMFESLKLAVRGTLQDDTVQYYTACSYYRFGDLISAEQAFNTFIETFTLSPFIDEARFMYLDCLFDQTYRYELDQTPTTKALLAINEYMIDFPDNTHMEQCRMMVKDLEDRLDKKDYEAARLYYKIEDYKAAHYALKLVLKEDPNNIYREEIMYFTVMSAYKYALNSVHKKQKERYMIFTDEYFSFMSEFPDSPHRRQLDILAKKVRGILDTKFSDRKALTREEKLKIREEKKAARINERKFKLEERRRDREQEKEDMHKESQRKRERKGKKDLTNKNKTDR